MCAEKSHFEIGGYFSKQTFRIAYDAIFVNAINGISLCFTN